MSDPRFDLGLYSLPEAARLARVPGKTLSNWVNGYTYTVAGSSVRARPVIVPTAERDALSFVNLMEALALAGFRGSGVSMQRARRALRYVGKQLGTDHPLASRRMLTDGADLFWEFQKRFPSEQVEIVNASAEGQGVFPEAVLRYLREVEWARDSIAQRWWPGAESPGAGLIVVDPRRAFGAPVIAHTAIRTEDLFSRFTAGEPIRDLAHDYGVSLEQVEAAIRAEAELLAA